MYRKLIDFLKQEASKCGTAELMRRCGASKHPFYRALDETTSPRSDTFCEWLEKIGVQVLLPGESQPGHKCSDCEKLKKELERLEIENSLYEQLVLKLSTQAHNTNHPPTSNTSGASGKPE